MRKRKFSETEKAIHEKYFSELKDYEMDPIFKSAEVAYPEAGSKILEQGQVNESLMLITAGSCDVLLPNAQVVTLGDGKFIGEMSFIGGEPVSADIVANQGCTLYVWKKEKLEKLFASHALYKPYIFSLCSNDMAAKLRRMSAHC